MKLTIFGATGGVGACLVQQALAAGHEVTAVVRDPARLSVASGPGLRVLTADIMDPAAIEPAVTAADAVLTSVGPRGTGPTSVITDSINSIVAAMQKGGTARLIMVSGSIAADDGGFFLRSVVKPAARRTFLRHICADMRAAEAEVETSGLDWTIVRPPRLTGKPATGSYRSAAEGSPPRGLTISRADLAACMLALLDDPAAVRRHIGVAS
ncbi:MAG TPA: NAD(P)-binding oxidoreductase [Streptosporangiaceae bacterium]|nr:NAD(P)-binding oxidoreductase [Streptosporangiaceae bacterium]